MIKPITVKRFVRGIKRLYPKVYKTIVMVVSIIITLSAVMIVSANSSNNNKVIYVIEDTVVSYDKVLETKQILEQENNKYNNIQQQFVCYDLRNLETQEEPKEETQEEPIVEEKEINEEYISFSKVLSISNDELETIAKLVFAESGGECYECQEMIASVFFNSMIYNNRTVIEELSFPNRYSTYPFVHDTYTDSCYNATISAYNKSVAPSNCLYYRANYYHDFGTPYCNVGNVYFSTI